MMPSIPIYFWIMDESQFTSDAPGQLVRTSFLDRGKAVEGWAFVPNRPPSLAEVLERVGPSGVGTILDLQHRASVAMGLLEGIFRQTPGGVNFNRWVLLRPLRLREARLSSQIENTVASAKEVGLLDIEREGRSEPLEVRNYMRAVEMAAQSAGPMTETKIRALHTELLRDVPRSEWKTPGKYRQAQVFIGDEELGFAEARFVPPPPQEVPRLMTEFAEYLNNSGDTPPLLAAGIAHYQFETIHPFSDGNGRLGRMLITLSLCDGSALTEPLIYPSGYIDRYKQAYYDGLRRVSLQGDWSRWLTYFLTALLTEAEGTRQRAERLLELRQRCVDLVQKSSMQHRIISAIDFLFERPVLVPSMLRESIGGNDQTARNYCRKLEEFGVLRRTYKVGKQHVYEAHEILAIAQED